MQALFLAAPPETFQPAKDTTRVLMEAGAERGAAIWTCGHTDLEVHSDGVRARARRLDFGGGDAWFTAGAVERIDVAAMDTVWFRQDPPFDGAYLHATHILDLCPGPAVINSPAGLRTANEKLLALNFPELLPPTLVSSDPAAIRAFLAEVGGVGVAKPVDGFGGTGIYKLSQGDPNLGVLLQTATAHGTDWTVAQAYIDRVDEGDTRILLMDGEVIGAFVRVPAEGEFRGNMMQGGSVHAVELNPRQREIVAAVRPLLAELGLRLVGLDVVGDYLTEINVTSPTGFQEVRKLTGSRPEAAVWDAVLGAGEERA